MAIARSEVGTKVAEGVFHCVSRCIRRAFLCGEDQYTGRSYEHRREWIRSRLEAFATWSSAIGVCGVAVMSNHRDIYNPQKKAQIFGCHIYFSTRLRVTAGGGGVNEIDCWSWNVDAKNTWCSGIIHNFF